MSHESDRGHYDGAVVGVLHWKSPDCGFDSSSSLLLWDLFAEADAS